MSVPIKKSVQKSTKKTKPKRSKVQTIKSHKKRKHPDYGTSKLEERFAKNFLEKLGVEYIYQYKMGSIGRYLDYFLPESRIGIEIDGDYYHSYGLVYEQMSPMQKKNHRVDELKNHWCANNGVHLIRIWEHDINKHPEKVMEMLKEALQIDTDKQILKNLMNKRH